MKAPLCVLIQFMDNAGMDYELHLVPPAEQRISSTSLPVTDQPELKYRRASGQAVLLAAFQHCSFIQLCAFWLLCTLGNTLPHKGPKKHLVTGVSS